MQALLFIFYSVRENYSRLSTRLHFLNTLSENAEDYAFTPNCPWRNLRDHFFRVVCGRRTVVSFTAQKGRLLVQFSLQSLYYAPRV